MKIKINRESVCMADDMENHTITYSIRRSVKFTELFRALIQQGYFPCVSGNDVVWTLWIKGADLLSWVTKEDRIYSRFETEEPTVRNWLIRSATKEIQFRYYSSPQKRAQTIFQTFDGEKFHIWHDGFMDEYKSYHIPESVEEEWKKTISK